MGKTRGLGWIGLLTLGVGCASLLDLPDGDYHVECVSGETQCVGKTVQVCQDGLWANGETCSFECGYGKCVPECTVGKLQCVGNTVQSCVDGLWQDNAECVKQTCLGGICTGQCAPSEVSCAGKTVRVCDGGAWANGEVCPYVCSNGSCSGDCSPGDKRCSGNQPQICDNAGAWQDAAACTVPAPVCDAGVCIVPPSCTGLPATCGPSGNESCCDIKAVPGGTYNRSNDPAALATISDFRLDRFEITVGRFRKFVEVYPNNKPMAYTGAHPLITGSGWAPAWDAKLPVDQATLKSAVKCNGINYTWTDTPMANENLPMNCITWYAAFAFCAWDGGRLPTEAEWNYAAAGGNEQREYPWSNPPNVTTIDATYAVYACTGDGSQANNCNYSDILKVGSKSTKGDGRFGQVDLGGSVWEWNLDVYGGYNAKCINCANIASGPFRVFRGGGWSDSASGLLSSFRSGSTPDFRDNYTGARCARTP